MEKKVNRRDRLFKSLYLSELKPSNLQKKFSMMGRRKTTANDKRRLVVKSADEAEREDSNDKFQSRLFSKKKIVRRFSFQPRDDFTNEWVNRQDFFHKRNNGNGSSFKSHTSTSTPTEETNRPKDVQMPTSQPNDGLLSFEPSLWLTKDNLAALSNDSFNKCQNAGYFHHEDFPHNDHWFRATGHRPLHSIRRLSDCASLCDHLSQLLYIVTTTPEMCRHPGHLSPFEDDDLILIMTG
ncbi:hypothetical protein Ddc_10388 [Ditylenchus destructor]|nr:hypothetical protein Ddc_10388 [Ditylenchus destructor]